MSEADSGETGTSSSSSPERFSNNKIAKLIAEIAARTSRGETIDVESLGPVDETLDDRTQSLATEMLQAKCEDAKQIVDNSADVVSLLDAVKNWSERFTRKLPPDAFESLTTIFRMVGAAASGEYLGLSKTTIACLVGALLYCLSPIDVVPDVLPIVGLFDDAFVLSMTVKSVADELKTFRMWERLKTARSILASYLPYFRDIKRAIIVPGWMTENDDCSAEIEVLKPVFPNATFELFSWKSNASWDAARTYIDEQGPDELAEFLRKSNDLSSVALVGHSLGARLVARTLARLSKEPSKTSFWSRKPLNRVSQAFLLGAAIDVDDPDLPLAAKGVTAPLCNFFSQSDRVLGYLYRVSEQRTPIGLSGMAGSCENYIDCAVTGREESWLDFTEKAASILAFFKSTTFLTSFSLADSIASGLPEYYGHQFKLYAQFFKESALSGVEPTS
ncbi:MAG: DUF726 domain-containing protein [Thermoguttaceae bacterium]|nr:DUF726 domain-containing protein [Thermoguttaceae bacterium]